MRTYISQFIPYSEDRRVYPYRVIYPMHLDCINFAPITILYGNNGSGKSTLLNVIAQQIGLKNMTLGNDNEYFDGYVKKCSSSISLEGVPEDSAFIRSEDIMAPAFQQQLANHIELLAYRLDTQFVIATHSPFLLSIDGARIYDLDARPSMEKAWYELENMKAYYSLFKRFEDKFKIIQ